MRHKFSWFLAGSAGARRCMRAPVRVQSGACEGRCTCSCSCGHVRASELARHACAPRNARVPRALHAPALLAGPWAHAGARMCAQAGGSMCRLPLAPLRTCPTIFPCPARRAAPARRLIMIIRRRRPAGQLAARLPCMMRPGAMHHQVPRPHSTAHAASAVLAAAFGRY